MKMQARKTRGGTVEVTVIYSLGTFRLYRSIPGVRHIYTISNEYGIAIGYCSRIIYGIRSIKKLYSLFGDSLNRTDTGVSESERATLLDLYATYRFINHLYS